MKKHKYSLTIDGRINPVSKTVVENTLMFLIEKELIELDIMNVSMEDRWDVATKFFEQEKTK